MPESATFTCAMCKCTFNRVWTKEEADREAAELWGKHPRDWNDDPMEVCHDCYQKIDPATHPEQMKRAKKDL